MQVVSTRSSRSEVEEVPSEGFTLTLVGGCLLLATQFHHYLLCQGLARSLFNSLSFSLRREYTREFVWLYWMVSQI